MTQTVKLNKNVVTINYSEGVCHVRMAFNGVDGIRQILTWSFFTAV